MPVETRHALSQKPDRGATISKFHEARHALSLLHRYRLRQITGLVHIAAS
jgi:hypothetical protein